MYDTQSEHFMSLVGEAQCSWSERSYHPNIAKFFPYSMRQSIWDACAFFYHRNVLGDHGRCSACKYGYSGHHETIDRGRAILGK